MVVLLFSKVISDYAVLCCCAAAGRGSGAAGAVPADTRILFAVGGYAYSQQVGCGRGIMFPTSFRTNIETAGESLAVADHQTGGRAHGRGGKLCDIAFHELHII